jgi:hypothetical protein
VGGLRGGSDSPPAACLGTRPEIADRTDYPFFLPVPSIFLLGMLAFLRYIYLERWGKLFEAGREIMLVAKGFFSPPSPR